MTQPHVWRTSLTVDRSRHSLGEMNAFKMNRRPSCLILRPHRAPLRLGDGMSDEDPGGQKVVTFGYTLLSLLVWVRTAMRGM